MSVLEDDHEKYSDDLDRYRTAEGVYSFAPDDGEHDSGDGLDLLREFEQLDVAVQEYDEYDDYDHVGLRPIRQTVSQPSRGAATNNRLYHDGTHWWVTFANETAKLGNLDGLTYLSYALERPGPEGIRLLDIEMLVNAKLDDAANEGAREAEALLVRSAFDDEDPDQAELRIVAYSEATATEDRETQAGYLYALGELKRRIHEATVKGGEDVRYLQEQKRQIEIAIRDVKNRARRGPVNEGVSKNHIVRVRNAITYARDEALPRRHRAFTKHLRKYLVCESNSVVYDPPERTRWWIQRPS